jgi:hypothetical protein
LLLFRSYKSIAGEGISTPSLVQSNQGVVNLLEEKVTDELKASRDMKIADTLELDTLAPRKIDWDLRKGIKDKLDKLDRRTNKAITQLISRSFY